MLKKLFGKKKQAKSCYYPQEQSINNKSAPKKIVLYGHEKTGKSCIMDVYTKNAEFSQSYTPTIGVQFSTKSIKSEESEIKLQVWDMAGQEKFMGICNSFLKGADILLLVFDLTKRESFQYVKKITYDTAVNRRVNDKTVAFLVGNKCDKSEEREVSIEEAMKLGELIGGYIEVSAKTRHNIEDLFDITLQRKLSLEQGSPDVMSFYDLTNESAENEAFQSFKQAESEIVSSVSVTYQKPTVTSVGPNTESAQIVPKGIDPQIAKVVLIGRSGVGKTCISSQYTENVFHQNFISTIGVDFKIHVAAKEEMYIKLQVWDTAGQQRFASITKCYYKQAKAALVVYSVQKYSTFKATIGYIEDLRKQGQPTYLCLVGNMAGEGDNEQRQVTPEQGMKLAEDLKVDFMEMSARNVDQVNSLFQRVIDSVYASVHAN